MQQISNFTPAMPAYRGAGRVSSPKLRASLANAEDFEGLEEDVSRYDLLMLVKRVGKAAGFTARMTELLDYYMSFTREIDWEEGARPIVYQSLSRTALDLGLSERQIQRLEQALFELGALTWNDSGNHRRYGQRCPESGEILFAFGVDLAPLAALRPELEKKLTAKREHDRRWMETKRQISWYRRQIRSVLAELEEGGEVSLNRIAAHYAAYGDIALPIRSHFDLESLEALLGEHKALYEHVLRDAVHEQVSRLSLKMSFRSAAGVVYHKDTNQISSNELDTSKALPSCLQGKRNGNFDVHPASSEQAETEQSRGGGTGIGLEHITLKQAIAAASEEFRAHLPLRLEKASWSDLVEAAYRVRPDLYISQESWGRGCGQLGRTGAALCVLLTDQAARRENDPVRKPAAYFHAMLGRAARGELHLHRSVFGLLGSESANAL